MRLELEIGVLVMESIKMSIENLNMPQSLKMRMKAFIENQHQSNLKKLKIGFDELRKDK